MRFDHGMIDEYRLPAMSSDTVKILKPFGEVAGSVAGLCGTLEPEWVCMNIWRFRPPEVGRQDIPEPSSDATQLFCAVARVMWVKKKAEQRGGVSECSITTA